uniref:Uncharacterized protein n=1 Tax=Brassica oleracea TaxID=3712 RepID=A0A3P6AWG7_BRAOL|nr:unnamed protein product [Brassica oleracea]
MQNSPVFNYINNLSPIKPVRLIPIAQTFGSLSPSVYTPPHKGSRFKSHTYFSDPSKELVEEAFTLKPYRQKYSRMTAYLLLLVELLPMMVLAEMVRQICRECVTAMSSGKVILQTGKLSFGYS